MTTSRFVASCPKDGSELIAWGLHEDAKPYLEWAETWRYESIGYEGTEEERRSRGADIGLMFAAAQPADGDVQHLRYVIECKVCHRHPDRGPIRRWVIREESAIEYVFPVLQALRVADDATSCTYRVDNLPGWIDQQRRRA